VTVLISAILDSETEFTFAMLACETEFTSAMPELAAADGLIPIVIAAQYLIKPAFAISPGSSVAVLFSLYALDT